MKKLSFKEWIAVAVGVIFVGYTLFGSDIMSLFQKNMNNNIEDTAAAGVGVTTPTGVTINDLTVGKGAEIQIGKRVFVHYILSLSDGTTLQNSKDFGKPFDFVYGVDKMILGWEQGIVGMKVGGIRTIVVPPGLAYGAAQQGPIPPNSTLVFTIELLDVQNPE